MSAAYERDILGDALWGVFIWVGVFYPAHKEEIVVHRGDWSNYIGGGALWVLSYNFSNAGKRAFFTLQNYVTEVERALFLELEHAC